MNGVPAVLVIVSIVTWQDREGTAKKKLNKGVKK